MRCKNCCVSESSKLNFTYPALRTPVIRSFLEVVKSVEETWHLKSLEVFVLQQDLLNLFDATSVCVFFIQQLFLILWELDTEEQKYQTTKKCTCPNNMQKKRHILSQGHAMKMLHPLQYRSGIWSRENNTNKVICCYIWNLLLHLIYMEQFVFRSYKRKLN